MADDDTPDASDTDAPDAPDAPHTDATEETPAAKKPGRGIQVPAWALVIVAALAVGGVGYAIGDSANDSINPIDEIANVRSAPGAPHRPGNGFDGDACPGPLRGRGGFQHGPSGGPGVPGLGPLGPSFGPHANGRHPDRDLDDENRDQHDDQDQNDDDSDQDSERSSI